VQIARDVLAGIYSGTDLRIASNACSADILKKSKLLMFTKQLASVVILLPMKYALPREDE
jgi:hypothetical protein